MASAQIFTDGNFQGVGTDGLVVPNGKLYIYDNATGLLATTYQDSAQTITNVNPVILSASGKAKVFLSAGTYDITLKTSADVTVWTLNDYIADDVYSKTESDAILSARTVGTISALRTTVYSGQPFVSVTGYYTAADNIGVREYYWDATSTEADNGGTIIQATGVVTGRWKMKYSGAMNAKFFGIYTDGSNIAITTAALQACVNAHNEVDLPVGNIGLQTVVIPNGCTIRGAGMANTFINPTDTYNTFILSGDKITLADFAFQGLVVNPVQNNVSSHCIYSDAVTYNAAFTRPLEGIKINRVGFRNLKGAALYINQPIRESFLSACRIVGMGSTTISPVHSKQTLGSANNTNNLHIYGNMFYRFASPALGFYASTLAVSGVSYADIFIGDGNLFHNQLLDESQAIPTSGTSVCAAPTDTLYIEEVASIYVASGNKVTAVHPQYSGLKVVNTNDLAQCKSVIIGDVYFSFNGGRTDIVYPSTGHYVNLENPKSTSISANSMYGGLVASEILITTTGTLAATAVDINILGVSSEAADVVAVLPTLYSGVVALNGKINATSLHVAAGTAASPSVQVGDVNSGFYNAADNVVGLSINGAVNTLFYSTSFRPYPDNTNSLGTAAQRWSIVYAGTGTINTSDITTKTFYEISEAERLCAIELKGMMRKFRFNDSIDSKGEANARIHFGVGAQYVRDVFDKYNLNPFDYALLCYDSWDDEFDNDGNLLRASGDIYGIRYEELLCFIISAM